jgi:hypothetical protein
MHGNPSYFPSFADLTASFAFATNSTSSPQAFNFPSQNSHLSLLNPLHSLPLHA